MRKSTQNLHLLLLCGILLFLVYFSKQPPYQPALSLPYKITKKGDKSTFYYDYVIQRKDFSEDIAIIVVVEGAEHRKQYRLAQDSLGCYARLQSYPLYFLDITEDKNYGGHCPHKDFMFKRHCVVSHFMSGSNHSWFLFLDGDIGVINPNHFLEQYLPAAGYSILFYKRIFNHEISSGSYIAKNDAFSRKFLLDWANYEFHLPRSFHGSDNGAIHSAVADTVVPGDPTHRNLCSHFWKRSGNDYGLSRYSVCLQLYLEKFPPPKVQILEKGRQSYSRDGWLTASAWSHKDFMFHGWQLKRRDKKTFAGWHSPLIEEDWDMEKCYDQWTAGQQWRYKRAYFRTDALLDTMIYSRIQDVAEEYLWYTEEVKKVMKSHDNMMKNYNSE